VIRNLEIMHKLQLLLHQKPYAEREDKRSFKLTCTRCEVLSLLEICVKKVRLKFGYVQIGVTVLT